MENKELEMTIEEGIEAAKLKDEETNKLNEEIYELALDRLNTYKLEWNFRSINHVLYSENISFGQLRSCVYMQDESAVYNYIKSTMILIKAGLIGSGQLKSSEPDKLENKAYEIIEDWRQSVGFIGTLHLLIINQMETKNFFMGTPDVAVVNHLSYKNLQTDLVQNLVSEDLEVKLKQLQALSTVY